MFSEMVQIYPYLFMYFSRIIDKVNMRFNILISLVLSYILVIMYLGIFPQMNGHLTLIWWVGCLFCDISLKAHISVVNTFSFPSV